MSALSIQPTYPIFTETDGQPLEDGYIWIGTANLDPQGNPINVYWDAAMTQLAGQPIRTQGGYPVNSGTPARLYVNSDYSIRVLDKKGSLVYSAPESTERYGGGIVNASDIAFTGFKSQSGTVADLADADGADWIGFTPQGTNAVARSAQEKMRDFVSVKDYGAVGDGVIDDSQAFADAVADCLTSPYPALYVPAGSYYLASGAQITGTTADRFTMYGDGRASDIFTNNPISTVDLVGEAANTFQYPYLRDLAIRNTNAAGTALRTRNTEFLRVVRCTIAGGLNGMMMSENGGESDIKPQIHECIFAGSVNGLKGGDTRVADAVIRDNLFIDCTTSMMDFGYLDGGTIAGNKLFSNNAGTNAVIGMRLKKPIYTVVEDNAFFELGGIGLSLTSPRYSRFKNNQIVNVGQNAKGAAIQVLDFDGTTAGLDVQITGNTIKDVDGHGIYVFSPASIQTDYLIANNYFKNVGDGSVLYDAINLRNCSAFTLRENIIDGDAATRYWLYLDASTGIVCDGNTYTQCVNTDVGRVNNPTMLFKQGAQNNLNVTATTTLTFNDDTVLCDATGGAITINLPSAASCPGKIYRVGKKDASVNAVTIDPASTQTVDGAATLAITTQWQVVTIMADGSGTNWITVSI